MADLKPYIQYQKPMAAMLVALAPATLFGIYNFGWRVLAAVLLSAFTCWALEYAFTRKAGKPASMAALVTGVLLALVLPPNIPFWMILGGAAFAIVFTKMIFGGFGKNIFNPAIAGRCLLYVSFPIAMTGSWFGPLPGPAGGGAAWTTNQPVSEAPHPSDAISGATIYGAAKRSNQAIREERASANPNQEVIGNAQEAFASIRLKDAVTGRISGCMGETSAIAILLGLAFLVYRKAVKIELFIAPLLGLCSGVIVFSVAGVQTLPLGKAILLNIFAGGTLFGCAFMTTEPITAPMNTQARWTYGILIGVFASVIRTLSVFPAGLMFSILLGNMFGPIIEYGFTEYGKWRKAVARAKEAAS